jgi:hypothetical protein
MIANGILIYVSFLLLAAGYVTFSRGVKSLHTMLNTSTKSSELSESILDLVIGIAQWSLSAYALSMI